MRLDDRVTIRTPEGVDLELTLAGAGSRIAAALLDGLILAVLIVVTMVAVTVVGVAADPEAGTFLLGFASLLITVEIIGYYVAFEGLRGKTPGKMALGLRVTAAGGEPLGLGAAAVRNLIRIVDFLPVAYGVGLVAMLISEQNQRLGDMAAGTIVVRERFVTPPAESGDEPTEEGPAWDVSAITADDLALVRRFVERARSLPADRRRDIASQIAAKLRNRVVPPRPIPDDEAFLRALYAQKRARRR